MDAILRPAVAAVELYGLARHRAGVRELPVPTGTLGDVLAALIQQAPGLADLIDSSGRLSRRYLVTLDGERFLDDLSHPVAAGARVIVLGADAGG